MFKNHFNLSGYNILKTELLCCCHYELSVSTFNTHKMLHLHIIDPTVPQTDRKSCLSIFSVQNIEGLMPT